MLLLLSALITTACLATSALAQPRDVTYARDIAPILDRHCASCHRPDGLAPFSLLTYDDARRRAALIEEVTKRRYMPPWKPEPGYGEFEGARRLSEDEIDLIQRWAAAGAPEGEPAERPQLPIWPEGWRLGPPDLVARMPVPYKVSSDGRDVYRNFAIPIPLTEPRYVRAVELRPTPPGVVHHARMLIDRTSSSRDLDQADPAPGYDGMLVDRATFPDGHFLGWAPGKVPSVTPDGLAWQLDPGTDVVLQVHILPTGRTELLQAEVGFYFADAPPVETPVLVLLGSKTIDIAAGERAHIVEDRYTLPLDVDVVGIYPHAHYLGRRIESFAELPDGGTRWLLLIKDWDFNWQDEYRYVDPVRLPQGSTLVMRFTFDNSSANPRNPHNPPRRVRFGSQSTDEMAELMVQVLTKTPADRARLVEDISRKLLEDDMAGFRTQLDRDPRDYVSHTGLGVRYLERGDIGRALLHLEEAIRIAPSFASGHYHLGIALVMNGRGPEAVEHYRRAIALRPEHAQAHNNLGGVLQSMGKVADAEMHYRLAVQFQPSDADAHYNLANLLQAQGQLDQAMAHFQLALKIAPDDAETRDHLARVLASQRRRAEAVAEYRAALREQPNLVTSLVDLAWLLATSPEAELQNAVEAVRLAERAAELTNHRHVSVLDTLAAAYAADGRFDKAVETAQTAAILASRANAPELAAAIERRRQLYLQYRPFRMAP